MKHFDNIKNWFLKPDRTTFVLIIGLLVGFYAIISSLLNTELKTTDLTVIDGTIKKIYEEEERSILSRNYNRETFVYLELNEYSTSFILGKKGNSFSAEKFNYGNLNDIHIFLHIMKKDIDEIKKELTYEPYSAWTKSMTLLPLEKKLAERNSEMRVGLIFGIIILVISPFFYFLLKILKGC